jgi:phenylacetaldehyde dehydrogenase
LAESATTGAVISLTSVLSSLLPVIFRGAAHQVREGLLRQTMVNAQGSTVEVLREPLGPALAIAPWNAPAVIAAHKVASALAAGCPVILKPSEWAPHACRILAEVGELAGLPKGTLQLVHGTGPLGARLVQDTRLAAISFTGGLVAGRSVARTCAETLRPYQLELGGNNALVALPDAQPEQVARGIVQGLTTLNGQWCRALGRILLPRANAAKILGLTLDLLGRVRLGHSLDAQSTMGPLIHTGHFEHVKGAIARLAALGGTVFSPTALPSGPSLFLGPTLLTGLPPETTTEEIFGPVATVHEYETEAEALAWANGTPYGLAGYVFGEDETRALAFARRMRTGSIKVNGVTLLSLHPDAPRPAWGLSGVGEEGTRESILFFTGARVVGRVSLTR